MAQLRFRVGTAALGCPVARSATGDLSEWLPSRVFATFAIFAVKGLVISFVPFARI